MKSVMQPAFSDRRFPMQTKSLKNYALAGLLALYAIVLFVSEKHSLANFGLDWRETYYPATSLLLQGQNPYLVKTLHNPIWGLFPLIPLCLIGEKGGAVVMFFVAFSAYVYVARALGASHSAIFLYMASPLIIYNLMLGNIDWLVILGFVMPPTIGLFFVILKPQIGIAVIVYWLYTSYKKGGIKDIIKTFSPVAILTAASFFLFGNWLVDRSDNLMTASWNLNLFPYSIPIGLILLYMAQKNYSLAISASPFFSPYMSFGSWSIAQLGITNNNLLNFAITSTLWIFYFLLRHTQ